MLVLGRLLQLTKKWAVRMHVWTPRHGQTLRLAMAMTLSQLFTVSLALSMTKKAFFTMGAPQWHG